MNQVESIPPVAAVEMANATRSFGDFTALRDATLRVEPGTILGIIGPSGAGKTTCVRLMTGGLAATSGTVRVLGEDPQRFRRRTRERWATCRSSSRSTPTSPLARTCRSSRACTGCCGCDGGAAFGRCSKWSTCGTSAAVGLESSPVACSAGWSWHRRWCTSRSSSSSTSRRLASTRSCAHGCGRSSIDDGTPERPSS